MKASWMGQVLAESDETVVVEGNHYFPPDSIRREFFLESTRSSHCPWKGDASYFDIEVNGERNAGAAWFYPSPKAAAAEIAGCIAFWQGVEVSE